MITAVIFDMDGVLIDTEKWLSKFWCQAAGEAGFPMKPEDVLGIRSLASRQAAAHLQKIFGEEFDYYKLRERKRELMTAHVEEYGVEKKPGVDEILDYLRAHGIKTAVATATDLPHAEEYLKQIGVYEKFDKIVCTTMVENGKPAPDVYLYACEQIDEKPENCLAVEDSPNGVISAVSAGIRTIMVPDLSQPDEEIAGRITAKADTLRDVVTLLETGSIK